MITAIIFAASEFDSGHALVRNAGGASDAELSSCVTNGFAPSESCHALRSAPAMRMKIHEAISRTAKKIAEASGAEATVEITAQVPVTYNAPDLTEQMIPTLRRVAGEKFVTGMPAVTVAKDFSFFQEQVPGVFFFLGVRPSHIKPEDAAANHSPRFVVDDTALKTGVRAMANIAVDYLRASGQ